MNYKKIYDSIIQKARKENRSKGDKDYYEAHHIIPKCLGGEGATSQWKTHENIVLLTAREHYVCHWLLHEMYPENKSLCFSFYSMCQYSNKDKKIRPSSRLIEEMRKKHIDSLLGKKRPDHSEWMKNYASKNKGSFSGINHPFYGKKRPEHSKKLKGKKRTPFTETHKKRISEARQGKALGINNCMSNPEVLKKFYKKIEQYDLFGNHIKTWDSIKEAGESLKISRGNITLCCQKKYKRAGGFVWKYHNEN